MTLRLLHTADWHLGQSFYEYDRTPEHLIFLDWLTKTLVEKEVDVLLVSGDVFDVSNPSAATMRMFYNFLKNLNLVLPRLQIVMIAGNHDSASRLEAPKLLLEFFNITVVGVIQQANNQDIDYSSLVIPLKNMHGETKAFCMAFPFLRPGDYPSIPDSQNPYADGITAVYQAGYNYALSQKHPGQAIVAMGHLHALNARVTENDRSERIIMGGLEFVPAAAFNQGIAYTALGHLHKAQIVNGNENVRYAGSPLPMSFSESGYKHQVVLVEIDGETCSKIETLPIPVSVQLLNIPAMALPFDEVLNKLELLPNSTGNKDMAPFVQIKVLLQAPEPSLRFRIDEALKSKQVRLARIETVYSGTGRKQNRKFQDNDDLQILTPADIFSMRYESRYNAVVPDELMSLFQEVFNEVNQVEY